MKITAVTSLCIILPALLSAQDHAGQRTKEEIQKMHQDPKAYISMLENPQREEEQKPDEVIAAMHLREGETIADIGAGSGYFAFRFAPHVGNSGRVYAVDINPDMILYMNRRIRDLEFWILRVRHGSNGAGSAPRHFLFALKKRH